MSADRCTTHHHACDCREAAHQAALAAAQARIAELEAGRSDFIQDREELLNERRVALRTAAEFEAERDAAITERDNYRTSAEKVAYVHVGLVMERDAALAQVQALSDALEKVVAIFGRWDRSEGRPCVCGDPTKHTDICDRIAVALAQSPPAAAERRDAEQAVIVAAREARLAYQPLEAKWNLDAEESDGGQWAQEMSELHKSWQGALEHLWELIAALDGGAAPEEPGL